MPYCDAILPVSRAPATFRRRPAFTTTPAVPASEVGHRPLHLNGYWLPPVSYMQIPPDIELGGPTWDKLLGDIILSMGRHIFPGGNRKLGFVTPHKDTEASLTNFFGSIESREKPPSTVSLRNAVEARLLRFLSDARQSRRSTSIITATKGVGPTTLHGGCPGRTGQGNKRTFPQSWSDGNCLPPNASWPGCQLHQFSNSIGCLIHRPRTQGSLSG